MYISQKFLTYYNQAWQENNCIHKKLNLAIMELLLNYFYNLFTIGQINQFKIKYIDNPFYI